MKLKMVALPAFFALFMSGFTVAPGQASMGKNDPLVLVGAAINVARNSQNQNMDGLVAIYIGPDKWAAGLKDGDLGPFLKLQEQKPGRSAFFFISRAAPANALTTVVYFDGNTAFGVTAAKADANGKIRADEISTGYKAVTEEMLKGIGLEFALEQVELRTDDDEPLPGYVITIVSSKPAKTQSRV